MSDARWRQPDAVFREIDERRLARLRLRLGWHADPLGKYVGPLSLVSRERSGETDSAQSRALEPEELGGLAAEPTR